MYPTDEREETLREVAALGNVKATAQLVHSGVKINSQNVMNGWTALHWAAHRGDKHVVTVLLRNGADPFIKTNKGQTAFDLSVNHSEVMQILKQMTDKAEITMEVGPEPTLPIVPTYMSNPDLEKTWLMPDEFAENKMENIVRKQKASELSSISSTTENPSVVPTISENKDSDEERETLVYLTSVQDDNLLGAVFLKNQPIETAIEDIKEEINGLPEKFNLYRHNGKMAIPINIKQYSKKLFEIFKSENDVIVVVSVE